MGPRIRRLSLEVARFSAVNVVATAVALVLFNLLVHGLAGWFEGPLNPHVITAYLLANSVGMFVSYYGTRHYAFRHRHAAGPGGGMLAYVGINLASFAIPVTCLWVTRHLLEWDSIYADNISGNVVGALMGFAFRFWAFRRFVFNTPRVFQLHHEPGRHEEVPERGPEDLSEVDP